MAKLRVHNIEPSTGTDVAFGTTGDTIAVSSDSLKLNTWKDSGGNTLFQSDGSGTLSNVNSDFSGAGPKLILSQTASDSASISFTADIDNTYDKYMFVMVNINPATDNTTFSYQASTDGGSNYNTTMTTTTFTAYHREDNASAGVVYKSGEDQAQGTAFQIIADYTGNDADENCAGVLHLFNPSSTTYVKQFYARFNNTHNLPQTEDFFTGGYHNTTSAINAVQFKFSSGNFDGKIKMYGVT